MDTPVKKEKRNYIDNKVFFEALQNHSARVKAALAEEKIPPKVSNYLGDCFLKIADNLALMHKFRNYPFIEEMKSDAVYCCLKYIDNFDPERFNNPFGYFTKVSYWAFVRRIQDEKKNLYKKYKAIENTEIFSHVSDTQSSDTDSYDNSVKYSEHSREKMVEFIEKFETSVKKKKMKTDGTT